MHKLLNNDNIWNIRFTENMSIDEKKMKDTEEKEEDKVG